MMLVLGTLKEPPVRTNPLIVAFAAQALVNVATVSVSILFICDSFGWMVICLFFRFWWLSGIRKNSARRRRSHKISPNERSRFELLTRSSRRKEAQTSSHPFQMEPPYVGRY